MTDAPGQTTLFGGRLDGRPLYATVDAIGQRWWEFHLAHPEVLHALVKLARTYREARGADARLGAKMLWERLRWDAAVGAIPGIDPESYKLNNNYASRYARHIMATCPDLAGAFELRELAADRAEAA